MKRTRLKRNTDKAKQWLRKSKLSDAIQKLNRRKPLKARGRRWAEKRKERFGVKAPWVCAMGCVVCGKTPCDPHHEPPVSRGGKTKDLVPLCREHHTAGSHSRHQLGSTWTFLYVHGIDLVAEAARIEREWRDAA